MFDSVLVVSAFVLVFYSLYKLATQDSDYFVKRGVAFIKPQFVFGSSKDFFFKKITLGEWAQRLYTSLPTER